MTYPLIILEGGDGCGKTTLATELEKLMGAKNRHLTYRFKDCMPLYHTAAMELSFRTMETQPAILDRWWMSEAIYANVFRGGTKWPMMGRILDRVALSVGAIYVICLPHDKEAYLQHFNKLKGERVEMFDNMSKVYDEYQAMWEKMKHRSDVIRYDWMQQGEFLPEMAELIMRKAYDHKAFIPEFKRTDRRIAGQLQLPDVLFVGDQSNPKTRRPVWPFFEHGNSSLWITQLLEDLGLGEDKIAWINAYGPDGKCQWHLEELHKTFYPGVLAPQVVALGKRARDAMNALGITVDATLPHPQWCKRFAPETSKMQYKLVLRELGVIK